jgi:multiple sugar transport system ATP-binding protein
MASLQVNNLSKSFGRIHALQDVTLNVHDGEFLTILGPTGAGKTTTLRCVAGLEKPDKGSIVMNGEPVDHLSPAERDVALVFQSYALYPRKTVAENMAFPLQARKLSKNEIEQRIHEVARKLEIEGLLNRRPAQLSGGQQQRVALGRAMVRQPQAFLMDEPLTNLDFKLRAEMRGELKNIQKELGATFFYVTNDQVEAMSMADRIVVLNKGMVQQVDTPERVYDRPANLFVAGFVGSPRMNFLRCRLDGHTLSGSSWKMNVSPQQAEQIQRTVGAHELVMGVRPEDVTLLHEAEADTNAGTVYVIEPLGDRAFVDFRVGGETVKAKTAANFTAASGATFWLRFDPERFHVFDVQSGETIF